MWPSMEPANKVVPGRAFLIAGTSSRRSSEMTPTIAPLQSRPIQTIKGHAAIMEHVVLNDQIRVLTKDRNGSVSLWDITTGCELQNYGKVELNDKLEELHQYVSVPRWFSTGLCSKCGCTDRRNWRCA